MPPLAYFHFAEAAFTVEGRLFIFHPPSRFPTMRATAIRRLHQAYLLGALKSRQDSKMRERLLIIAIYLLRVIEYEIA